MSEYNEEIAKHVKGLLGHIEGENVEREGLVETPMRVAKAYKEFFGGLFTRPRRRFG